MDEQRDFQDKQYAFAAHIRDPENTLAPDGIEDRRMAIYRTLFFNNLYNLLGTFFPVLRKIHTDEQWSHFIREFMKVHRAKTPYFLELPEEFLAFLQNEYKAGDDDFPFLTELAHYEYAELALSVSETKNDLEGVDPQGNLLEGTPVKSDARLGIRLSLSGPSDFRRSSCQTNRRNSRCTLQFIDAVMTRCGFLS